MMSTMICLLMNAFALVLMTQIVPGIHLAGFVSAIIAALVLGLVNTLVRPILSFFTIPLQLLTLGLFTLVINGAMLALTSTLVPGFTISSFSSAFIGSLVLSIISLILNHIFK